MKKILAIGFGLMLTMGAMAQISGTAHDFSSAGWSNGQICIACHTPHDADTTISNAPLWNHEITTATYTVYSGLDLQATVGQPDGISKLCLSCHDGTVALDSFGGATGTNFIAAAGDLGTALDNDHPISFTYDTALATSDGELYNPATQTSGLGGTIAEDMLFSDQLECASCHDVHGNGNNNLLLIGNGGSALCLTCHDK